MQYLPVLLSCVWFAHPLSWEQWIGAVRLTFTFIEHHNELSHCTLLSCITLFLSQPLDQYWSPLTLILNHHGSSSSHTICDTIFLMKWKIKKGYFYISFIKQRLNTIDFKTQLKQSDRRANYRHCIVRFKKEKKKFSYSWKQCNVKKAIFMDINELYSW